MGGLHGLGSTEEAIVDGLKGLESKRDHAESIIGLGATEETAADHIACHCISSLERLCEILGPPAFLLA